MNFHHQLEAAIRKRPKLYNLLRPMIPVINVIVTAERDFCGLRFIDFSGINGVAIDVGFNDGLSSTSMQKFLSHPIVAFEPLNVKINPITAYFIRKVTICRFGLSDCAKTTNIWTPVYRGKAFMPYSSTTKELAIENLSRDLGISSNLIQCQSNSIILRTLDSLNLDIVFLKIDTEGSEFEVLKGGVFSIAKKSPCILIEIASQKCFVKISAFLQTLNYKSFLFEGDQFRYVSEWDPTKRNYWFLSPSGPYPRTKV